MVSLEDNPEHLASLGIPPLYAAADVTDFPEITLGDLENGPGFFVTGSTGRGKTHLAVAILRRWLTIKGRASKLVGSRWTGDHYRDMYRDSAIFTTAADYCHELQSRFGNGDTQSVIRRHCSVTALVLDDFGGEHRSDWSFSELFNLIAKRINMCRPTIVTSNLSLDEISALEPRLASRLAGLDVLELGGPDRRLSRQEG